MLAAWRFVDVTVGEGTGFETQWLSWDFFLWTWTELFSGFYCSDSDDSIGIKSYQYQRWTKNTVYCPLSDMLRTHWLSTRKSPYIFHILYIYIAYPWQPMLRNMRAKYLSQGHITRVGRPGIEHGPLSVSQYESDSLTTRPLTRITGNKWHFFSLYGSVIRQTIPKCMTDQTSRTHTFLKSSKRTIILLFVWAKAIDDNNNSAFNFNACTIRVSL